MLSEVVTPSGYTAKNFRDALTRAVFPYYEMKMESIPLACSLSTIGKYFDVNPIQAQTLASFLVENNYASQHLLSDMYVLTRCGENVVRARSGKRFSREIANKIIADVQCRAQHFNYESDYSILPISHIIAFGSYIDTSNNALGDVDLVATPMAWIASEEQEIKHKVKNAWAFANGKRCRQIFYEFVGDLIKSQLVGLRNRNPRISFLLNEDRAGLEEGDRVAVIFPFKTLGSVEIMPLKDVKHYLTQFDRAAEILNAKRNIKELIHFYDDNWGDE